MSGFNTTERSATSQLDGTLKRPTIQLDPVYRFVNDKLASGQRGWFRHFDLCFDPKRSGVLVTTRPLGHGRHQSFLVLRRRRRAADGWVFSQNRAASRLHSEGLSLMEAMLRATYTWGDCMTLRVHATSEMPTACLPYLVFGEGDRVISRTDELRHDFSALLTEYKVAFR